MAQYIDKAAVIEEIERLDNYWHLSKSTSGQAFVESLFSFLDTLEVKEVDIEKEIDEHWDEWAKEDGFHSVDFAKYFFDLGLKARKRE